jgi:hypothetical protein
LWNKKKEYKFAVAKKAGGTLAQLVEQWTENPCVPGSIPGGTTKSSKFRTLFLCQYSNNTFAMLFRFCPLANYQKHKIYLSLFISVSLLKQYP